MGEKPVVLLSGFGPFGGHKINASWESVKRMSHAENESKYGVKIEAVEIPVVYNVVDEVIPQLWEKYDPKLVIHVGVSAKATEITLETIANNTGYERLDCKGKSPANGINNCSKSNGECQQLACSLDLQKICQQYNETLQCGIPACLSNNAGRYLCEYTFYASLSRDCSRSLFVHVPDLSDNYTAESIAKGLERVVQLCLEQLN